MKLTTKLLKKLVKEEMQKINEDDEFNSWLNDQDKVVVGNDELSKALETLKRAWHAYRAHFSESSWERFNDALEDYKALKK